MSFWGPVCLATFVVGAFLYMLGAQMFGRRLMLGGLVGSFLVAYLIPWTEHRLSGIREGEHSLALAAFAGLVLLVAGAVRYVERRRRAERWLGYPKQTSRKHRKERV